MSIPDYRQSSSLILWRAYVPRWSYEPLSGDGAGRYGGRWNEVGVPCLYAACELSTAWAEYNQGFVQHPAVIAQLSVSDAKLIDLTDDSGLREAAVDNDIHRSEWRDALDRGLEPATHLLAARLRKEGWDGLIYPSFMSPGGRCVAIWRWNVSDGGPRVTVIDPENRLPRSARSWVD